MTEFRVQRGSVDFGASSTTTTVTLPTAVDAERAFPRLANTRHTGSGRATASADNLFNDDLGARIDNWNGTSFQLVRNSTAEAVDHTYRWEVWEDMTDTALRPLHGWYVRGIKTPRLTAGVSSTSTSAFTDVVDWTQCIPFLCAVRSGSTARAWGEACVTLKMQSNKTVLVERDSASTADPMTASIAVVEFGSAWTIVQNLEHASITDGGTDYELSGAGSSTDWRNKFIEVTNRCGGGADKIDAISMMIRPKLGEDDTIIISTDPTMGLVTLTPHAVVCHVAYHPSMFVEHQDTKRYSGLRTLQDETIDVDMIYDWKDALDSNEIGVIATTSGPGNAQYPGMCWDYSLRSNGRELRYRRGREGGAAIDGVLHAFQVVRLPRIATSSGGVVGSASVPDSTGRLASSRSRGVSSAPSGTGSGVDAGYLGAGARPGAV